MNVRKILNHTLPILIGGVLLLSCTNQKEIDRNQGEIISILINEQENFLTKYQKRQNLNDSITIVIYHILIFEDDFSLREGEMEYQPLIDNLVSSNSKEQLFGLNLKYLDVKPNVTVVKSNDSLEKVLLQNHSRWSTKLGVYAVMSFTEIVLNKELDIAVVGLDYTYGPLSGNYGLYFFNKVDGVWKIEKVRTISIS